MKSGFYQTLMVLIGLLGVAVPAVIYLSQREPSAHPPKDPSSEYKNAVLKPTTLSDIGGEQGVSVKISGGEVRVSYGPPSSGKFKSSTIRVQEITGSGSQQIKEFVPRIGMKEVFLYRSELHIIEVLEKRQHADGSSVKIVVYKE
jgi:hypothetical protein